MDTVTILNDSFDDVTVSIATAFIATSLRCHWGTADHVPRRNERRVHSWKQL